VRLGPDLILPWCNKPFPYLGVGTHPGHSARRNRTGGQQKAPLDLTKKLSNNLYGLSQILQLGKGQPYLVTPALRFGVQQVINPGALYTTAINDTEYEELDRRTMATIRKALGLPSQMPEVYLRWALRLPPSHLYGHGQGMTAAFAIWHHSWVGQTLLQGIWTGDAPGTPRRYTVARGRYRPPPGSHPMFNHGPVARWNTLMAQYFRDPAVPPPHPNYPGLHLLHAAHDTWENRHRFRKMVKAKTTAAFKAWTLNEISTHKLPEPYLDAMRIVVEEDRCAPDEPPLWNILTDDLPRAVLLFQAPFLGHSFQEHLQQEGRPSCAWCDERDCEWGYHLLTCHKAPAHVIRQRDATLRAIVEDVHPDDDPTHAAWDSPTNMERLYLLNWRGKDPQQMARHHHRTDTGKQASAHVLRMAAWYMRTCINAYSPWTEHFIGRIRQWPRVNFLKVYGDSPFP
jgi:hypothetical protein